MFKKTSKYFPQILAALFLAGFAAYAWTDPSSAPPDGNVAAPINVGTVSQYKSGALGIGGVLRGYSDAIFDGWVGIGTTTPGAKLDIQGGDAKVGTATIKGDGSISSNLNADKLDGLDSADFGRQGLYGRCDVVNSSFQYCVMVHAPAFITGMIGAPQGASSYCGSITNFPPCACPAGYVLLPLNKLVNFEHYYLSCYRQ